MWKLRETPVPAQPCRPPGLGPAAPTGPALAARKAPATAPSPPPRWPCWGCPWAGSSLSCVTLQGAAWGGRGGCQQLSLCAQQDASSAPDSPGCCQHKPGQDAQGRGKVGKMLLLRPCSTEAGSGHFPSCQHQLLGARAAGGSDPRPTAAVTSCQQRLRGAEHRRCRHAWGPTGTCFWLCSCREHRGGQWCGQGGPCHPGKPGSSLGSPGVRSSSEGSGQGAPQRGACACALWQLLQLWAQELGTPVRAGGWEQEPPAWEVVQGGGTHSRMLVRTHPGRAQAVTSLWPFRNSTALTEKPLGRIPAMR